MHSLHSPRGVSAEMHGRGSPWQLGTAALVILVAASAGAGAGAATCPYDFRAASVLIPPFCYSNSTADPGNCCWYVSAAFLFAGVRHANLTGEAFLPEPSASACSSGFTSYVIGNNLTQRSLVLSGDRCNLNASNSAGTRPCLYPNVTQIRSQANFSDSVHLCSKGEDLSNQTSCTTCQNAVIAAVLNLAAAAGTKDLVSCGMSATVGIWAASPNSQLFRSYVLCMVQVLDSVPNLDTTDLIPSRPPSAPRHLESSSKKISRTTIAAVATVAAVVAFGVALALGYYFLREEGGSPPDGYTTAAVKTTLPIDGLYIFTRKELRSATNGFDRKLVLGEGGAGRVYLGTLPSGQSVAVKKIYLRRKVNEFYREVEIVAKLRHQNLTTLVGYCVQKREHVLVYEYMPGGTLAAALRRGELSWDRRLKIAADVAAALAYLHSNRVVHRDVKPGNVLLTEGAETAKVSDFGVSKVMPAEATHASTELKGTLGYLDPDCFPEGIVSEASDVYSFGIVLLELVTGRRAVTPTLTGGAESIVHVAREEQPEIEKIVDPRLGPEVQPGSVADVFELACRCVRTYRRERPTMEEVVAVLTALLAAARGAAASEVAGQESTSDALSGPASPRLSTPTMSSRSL